MEAPLPHRPPSIRLLNAHEDTSYDYASADTATYLHHEGPCCIPAYAAGLVSIGKDFHVRSGPFNSERLWEELGADCRGAAAARASRGRPNGVAAGMSRRGT